MDRRPPGRASAGVLPMSLEDHLDEENKEMLAGLTKSRSKSPIPPKSSRNRDPPGYRSMLDVGPPPPRHGSMPGLGSSIPSPRDQRKTAARFDPSDPSTWTAPAKPVAKLDPGDPSTWTSSAKPESPTTTTQAQGASQYAETVSTVPTIQIESKEDIGPSFHNDTTLPTSSGTRDKSPRESSSRNIGGYSSDKRASKDLSSTLTNTTKPPQTMLLSAATLQKKNRSASGSADNAAKRRLSEKSNSFSTVTSDSDAAGSRVLADHEGDEDALAESSSEDDRRVSSSESDEESPEDDRGRSRPLDELSLEKGKESETGSSKLAPQSAGVRSLIDPLLSPSFKEKSDDVHPPSSFGRSGPTAADFSKDDDFEHDIKIAKSLGLSMSPLDSSVADRHVRMIIRGNWAKFQDENENNNNSNPRLYLACTDLSTEASYAMEWTVGTMLRDGDTLLAVYAIEDENAPKEAEGNTQVEKESAQAAQDANDTMAELTRQTSKLESKTNVKFTPAIDAPTAASSTDLSTLPKKAVERIKAIDEITENFLKLVRKTPLQIRCMIEVIHCKSPKHLILNAIDTLDPTLCVVGTRGRSSLKGVLLGSFSNYLVTKSSVPVMVARRRLKKPAHAKVSSTSIKMANNLTNALMPRGRRSLTDARID